MLSSCIENSTYTSTEHQLLDFQSAASMDDIFTELDSEFCTSSLIQFGSFFFYSDAEGLIEDNDELYNAGFAIGRLADTTLYSRTTDFPKYTAYDVPVEESDSQNYFMIFQDDADAVTKLETPLLYAYCLYGDAYPQYVYVNNTIQTVACACGLVEDCVLTSEDWLKVTFTGYAYSDTEDGSAEVTGSVEFYLLDFRTVPQTLVSEWTEVDLTDLDYLDYIDIEVTSSNSALPKIFCLDDFYSTVTVAL